MTYARPSSSQPLVKTSHHRQYFCDVGRLVQFCLGDTTGNICCRTVPTDALQRKMVQFVGHVMCPPVLSINDIPACPTSSLPNLHPTSPLPLAYILFQILFSIGSTSFWTVSVEPRYSMLVLNIQCYEELCKVGDRREV
ncbi:hypothetical protein HOLleu_12078 [Holothuria leucospilota]|uniref:Uncharacterized protein n=1 Tax=Holothuria leucospilota TaxID=206669 RepID=A0A9Q1HDH6_HOLLE|nr:hypothetical protein HOLleu_12078 [Holothuria leucospilota]